MNQTHIDSAQRQVVAFPLKRTGHRRKAPVIHLPAGDKRTAARNTCTTLFPRALFGQVSTTSLPGEENLHPLERVIIEGAVDKRQREFAAGRHCAALAMRSIGFDTRPLLKDANGAPLWPTGATGSISHTSGLTTAVAARQVEVRGVGVDVEAMSAGFPQGAQEIVMVAAERDWLGSLPARLAELCSFALFSAKESVYKCVHAATGYKLRFQDLQIDPDLDTGTFTVRFLTPDFRIGPPEMHGKFGWQGRHVLTGAWWLTTNGVAVCEH